MKSRKELLRPTLLWNGIVDLFCVIVLMILPQMHRPLLGYKLFDNQGAFMAGGWGIATLALGLTRIWTSNKPTYHDAVFLMGLIEGLALLVFCIVNIIAGLVPILQVALPLLVGVIFGFLYLLSSFKKSAVA
jgi:hypothetical protein